MAARRLALGMRFAELRRCRDLIHAEIEEWYTEVPFFDLVFAYKKHNQRSFEDRYESLLEQAYGLFEDGIRDGNEQMMAFAFLPGADGDTIPDLLSRLSGNLSPLAANYRRKLKELALKRAAETYLTACREAAARGDDPMAVPLPKIEAPEDLAESLYVPCPHSTMGERAKAIREETAIG